MVWQLSQGLRGYQWQKGHSELAPLYIPASVLGLSINLEPLSVRKLRSSDSFLAVLNREKTENQKESYYYYSQSLSCVL